MNNSIDKQRSDQLSEFDLIAHYFAPIAAPEGLGLIDDVACLAPSPECDLVMTTDALVANIHFFEKDAPSSIARKALGVNVSDLVAKGANPRGFLLGLALPEHWTRTWLQEFTKGLKKAAEDWACPLLGGDTVRSTGGLMISITAIGEVPTGKLPKRCNAQEGDIVLASGTIGDAYLGLQLCQFEQSDSKEPPWAKNLNQSERSFLKDRYRHPAPKTTLIPIIRSFAKAAMDISDGLVGDFAKLCKASNLGASLNLEKNLFSLAGQKAILAEPRLLEGLLSGGDDYEVLFTVSPQNAQKCVDKADILGIPLTHIGSMQKTEKEITLSYQSRPLTLKHTSYRHF